MKKRLALILALALTLGLTLGGCGDKNTPETAVDNLFAAIQSFDTEAINGTLATTGQGDLAGGEEFANASADPMTAPFYDYLEANAEKITYEILETTTTGDTATVSVKCKYVDGSGLFSAIIEEFFTQAFTSAFSGEELTDEDMQLMLLEILDENLTSAEETFTEKTIDIACVKEDGVWVVKEMNEDLADVFTSNFLTAATELSELFGE